MTTIRKPGELQVAKRYSCGHCHDETRYDHCARCGVQLIDHKRYGNTCDEVQYMEMPYHCSYCQLACQAGAKL